MIAVIILGVWLFRVSREQAQIAVISGPVPTGTTCTTNLNTFDASGACSGSGFIKYSYTCKGEQTIRTVTSTASPCLTYYDAYSQAASACGSSCTVPSASPLSPSVRPSPVSTAYPSPYMTRPPSPSPRMSVYPTPYATRTLSPSPRVSPVASGYFSSPRIVAPSPTPPPGIVSNPSSRILNTYRCGICRLNKNSAACMRCIRY
jgi:hypothetical protein